MTTKPALQNILKESHTKEENHNHESTEKNKVQERNRWTAKKQNKKKPENIEESIMFNSENSNTTKETDNKNNQ